MDKICNLTSRATVRKRKKNIKKRFDLLYVWVWLISTAHIHTNDTYTQLNSTHTNHSHSCENICICVRSVCVGLVHFTTPHYTIHSARNLSPHSLRSPCTMQPITRFSLGIHWPNIRVHSVRRSGSVPAQLCPHERRHSFVRSSRLADLNILWFAHVLKLDIIIIKYTFAQHHKNNGVTSSALWTKSSASNAAAATTSTSTAVVVASG